MNLSKQERIEKKEAEDRIHMFADEVKRLSELYRVDIRGSLAYQVNGIIPTLTFVDVKKQYEAIAEETKEDKIPFKPKM